MLFSNTSKETAERKFAYVTEKLCDSLRQNYIDGLSKEDEDVAFAAKWIIAHSPLSDLVNFDFEFFASIARHGIFLLKNGYCDVPEEIFLNYVLPVRLGNEEICSCRKFFFDKLKDRIRGLSKRDAIIEINYFNAENVRYSGTDFRTMSALGTYNACFGRCGEETVFAVNVYRSVGIPARQVYTPRWAHCDDNHAWIEVWCDGKWRFMGACEPEESLDKGWFNAAAGRAMFIESVVFGETQNEEITYISGRATHVNCLNTYARTKKIVITIEGSNKPIQGARVMLSVLNNSHFFPCATLISDDEGKVSITTGLGDLFVRAVYMDMSAETIIDTRKGDSFSVVVSSDKPKLDEWEDFVFVAPVSSSPKTSPLTSETAEIAQKRLQASRDKLRAKTENFFDSDRAKAIVRKYGYSEFVYELLSESRGNFDRLCEFFEDERYSAESKEQIVLTIYQKDVVDIDPSVLKEALDLADEGKKDEFYYKYVLCPRVWFEPLTPCRKFILEYFDERQKAIFTADPREIWRFITENVKYYPQIEYGNVVTQPKGMLVNKSGSFLSQRILFVDICRALGIPSRLNPVNDMAEFYDGEFVCVEECESCDSTIILERDCDMNYPSDFCVGMERGDGYINLVTDGEWKDNRLEVRVKSGAYRIITDNRLPNGNIYASQYRFMLKSGETKVIKLHKHSAELSDMLSDYRFDDFTATDDRNNAIRMSELTKDGCVLIKLGKGEPTQHLLDEIRSVREKFDALNVITIKGEDGGFGKSICCSDRDIEQMQRQLYLDPDNLPLIVVADKSLHSVYASGGYNVGSVDMIIDIVGYLTKKG